MIDDDSDIFRTESNDTSNNYLNDDDCNQLQLKLHILNYFLLSNPIMDDLVNEFIIVGIHLVIIIIHFIKYSLILLLMTVE
jgi:hypothetical protein